LAYPKVDLVYSKANKATIDDFQKIIMEKKVVDAYNLHRHEHS